jgi:hypothetical protein
MVVALPLIVPPSCRPLALPLSCHLAPAGSCVKSCHTTLSSSRRATPSSSHRPITVLPSCCLIAPAGCCVASRCTILLLSSHRAALSSSCTGWLLHCLLPPRPLILLLCPLLVLLSSYHCATLLLSDCTGWLLRCLSSYRLLVVLFLCCSLVILRRLVVASTLVAPPSCHHVPTSLSSCHPITVLPSRCLIAPAGCCVASRCTALLYSSHCTVLSSSCSGWLLRQLRCVTLLSSRCAVLLSCRCTPAGCCVAFIN